MMLARTCSPRASLVGWVAFVLALLLLTASRLNNGSSAVFSRLAHDWKKSVLDKGGDSSQRPFVAGEPHDATSPPETPERQGSKFCARDLELLRSGLDLTLTENIVYTRRCVKPLRGKTDRDAVANISSPLFSDTAVINLAADCSAVETPPCEPLTLHVPPAYPDGEYRHLLFGVASTYQRLKDAIPVFAHWLSGTGAQLIAVVSDADDLGSGGSATRLAALEEEYRSWDMLVRIVPPKLKERLPHKDDDEKEKAKTGGPAPVEQLHFMLIRDMLEVATSETQWLGVIDDDTFFPSLYPLARELQRHDHTRPAWLGALADNFVSIKIWGIMAFGGAGTFLSVPLARELEPQLEECVRESTVRTGDGLLRDCVYGRTTTKLTLVPGLLQHDIRGDPSGLFESGGRPLPGPMLSLHHWKSWYKAPVDRMAAVARLCGECFLQRWRFADDALLANGYSVSVYRPPGLLDALDLDRVEATFAGADRPDDRRFDFFYGPFRRRLGPDQKKSYRLEAVAGGPPWGGGRGADGSGPLRQVYVHRARRDREGDDAIMDEVIELVWEV